MTLTSFVVPTMVPTKNAMRCSYSYEMIAASGAILDSMRADFESLSPDARSKLLTMLCDSGVESPGWWWDVLVGDGDPLYKPLA